MCPPIPEPVEEIPEPVKEPKMETVKASNNEIPSDISKSPVNGSKLLELLGKCLVQQVNVKKKKLVNEKSKKMQTQLGQALVSRVRTEEKKMMVQLKAKKVLELLGKSLVSQVRAFEKKMPSTIDESKQQEKGAKVSEEKPSKSSE